MNKYNFSASLQNVYVGGSVNPTHAPILEKRPKEVPPFALIFRFMNKVQSPAVYYGHKNLISLSR